MKKTRRTFTESQKIEMIREHLAGASVKAVLEKHQIVSSVFGRWRRELEAKAKRQIKADQNQPSSTAVAVIGGRGNKLPKAAQEQIIQRLNAGERGQAIADSLGVHISSVYYYAKKWREGGGTIAGTTDQAAPSMPVITGPMVTFAKKTELDLIRAAAAEGRRFSWGEKRSLLLVAMVIGEALD